MASLDSKDTLKNALQSFLQSIISDSIYLGNLEPRFTALEKELGAIANKQDLTLDDIYTVQQFEERMLALIPPNINGGVAASLQRNYRNILSILVKKALEDELPIVFGEKLDEFIGKYDRPIGDARLVLTKMHLADVMENETLLKGVMEMLREYSRTKAFLSTAMRAREAKVLLSAKGALEALSDQFKSFAQNKFGKKDNVLAKDGFTEDMKLTLEFMVGAFERDVQPLLEKYTAIVLRDAPKQALSA